MPGKRGRPVKGRQRREHRCAFRASAEVKAWFERLGGGDFLAAACEHPEHRLLLQMVATDLGTMREE